MHFEKDPTVSKTKQQEIVDTIFKNVNALFELRHIDKKKLADELGVSESYFAKQHNDIPTTRYYAMAKKFDVDPNKLWDPQFTAEIRIEQNRKEIERLTAEIEEIKKDCIQAPEDSLYKHPEQQTPHHNKDTEGWQAYHGKKEKVGKWLWVECVDGEGISANAWKCSNCGEVFANITDQCPNCKAIMGGEE